MVYWYRYSYSTSTGAPYRDTLCSGITTADINTRGVSVLENGERHAPKYEIILPTISTSAAGISAEGIEHWCWLVWFVATSGLFPVVLPLECWLPMD